MGNCGAPRTPSSKQASILLSGAHTVGTLALRTDLGGMDDDTRTKVREDVEVDRFHVQCYGHVHGAKNRSVPFLLSKVDVPILYQAPSYFLLCFLLYQVNGSNKHLYSKLRESESRSQF